MEIISRPGNRGRNNMYVTEKSEYGFKKKIYTDQEAIRVESRRWVSEVRKTKKAQRLICNRQTGEERAWMLTELGMRT